MTNEEFRLHSLHAPDEGCYAIWLTLNDEIIECAYSDELPEEIPDDWGVTTWTKTDRENAFGAFFEICADVGWPIGNVNYLLEILEK